MRILWDKELFTILDQEFLEFECERCIDEAKDWSELIVHKENSHGDVGAGIGSIQVKLSNCDKCGHNCVLRNRFGSHIQSLHVWTDHMKPSHEAWCSFQNLVQYGVWLVWQRINYQDC